MGTIVGMVVIYFLVGKGLGKKAKAKGYDFLVFIILMYLFYFGIMFLAAFLLDLVFDTNDDSIGVAVGYISIILGIASSYFLPNLILNKLPNKKSKSIESNLDKN